MSFKNSRLNNWTTGLVCISFALWLVNVAIFFPGYMSPDSIDSLGQALGLYGMHDWHPVYFTLIWKSTIAITGSSSVMYMLILLLQWTFLSVLAAYIYRYAKSKKLSLLPLLVGVTPVVLGVSGVVWKDVLMVNFLGIASVISIWLYKLESKSLAGRIVLFCTAVFCIVSAALLRYNVLPAILPLLWFLAYSYGGIFTKSKRLTAAMVAGVFMLIIVLSWAIPVLAGAQKTNPSVGVMIDDVIHVATWTQVEESSLPYAVKQELHSAQAICEEKGVVVNAYIVCIGDSSRGLLSTTYYNEVKSFWIRTVLGNIPKYALYRTHAFSLLAISPDSNTYIWQDGIIPNELGKSVASNEMREILGLYVMDLGYRHFPFLFTGWFWFIVALVVMYRGWRTSLKLPVVSIVGSGVIYFLTYLILTVAADYRYIYWLVISSVIGLMLLLVSRFSADSHSKVSTVESVKIRAVQKRRVE